MGRPPDMILGTVEHLEVAHFFMPPWAGTPEEAQLLTDYLTSIRPPRPAAWQPLGPAKETP